MQLPQVRVSPDPKYSAEVVVLLTTLGAKRTEFNAGKRARDLLEIKRVHHKIVDFNRDARQAGTGEAENQAIQKLMVEGKLQTGENDDLILPQIFIDGRYMGDANDLQGLEDDAALDGILLRKTCVKCNDRGRSPESVQCQKCWEKFEEILPGLMTMQQVLQELALTGEDGDYDGDDYDDEDYDADEVAAASGLATQLPAQRRTLEESFRIAGAGTAPQPVAAPTASRGAGGYGAGGAPPAVTKQVDRAAGVCVVGNVGDSEETWHVTGGFRVGDQVQYWSVTKNRWVDTVVEAVRTGKDGNPVYDLECKKNAQLDKIQLPKGIATA